MLEERIKRSAKKTPPAPAKQAERAQREHPTNPNAMRKPAPQEDMPNKLKYVNQTRGAPFQSPHRSGISSSYCTSWFLPCC